MGEEEVSCCYGQWNVDSEADAHERNDVINFDGWRVGADLPSLVNDEHRQRAYALDDVEAPLSMRRWFSESGDVRLTVEKWQGGCSNVLLNTPNPFMRKKCE